MEWIGVRKKLTPDEVKKIGVDIGLVFPSDYCRLIGEINGGGLESAVVDVPGLGRIPYSRNINLCSDVRGNAINLYKIYQKRGIKCFPIASVGNGDYYCYDTSTWNVVVWLHEDNRIVRVCKTFSKLLKMISD